MNIAPRMDSQNPAHRRPIPTRVKIIMTLIMIGLASGLTRLALYVGRKEGFSKPDWPKPFGLGIGPSNIGGRDTVWDGHDLILELYSSYRHASSKSIICLK